MAHRPQLIFCPKQEGPEHRIRCGKLPAKDSMTLFSPVDNLNAIIIIAKVIHIFKNFFRPGEDKTGKKGGLSTDKAEIAIDKYRHLGYNSSISVNYGNYVRISGQAAEGLSLKIRRRINHGKKNLSTQEKSA